MPVPFGYFFITICLVRERPLLDVAGVCSETHAAALVAGHIALLNGLIAVVVPLFQEVNDGMRRPLIEFRTVRSLEACEVPRRLDHCALHSEADAEIRDISYPRECYGSDLAFYTAN